MAGQCRLHDIERAVHHLETAELGRHCGHRGLVDLRSLSVPADCSLDLFPAASSPAAPNRLSTDRAVGVSSRADVLRTKRLNHSAAAFGSLSAGR